MKIDDLTIEQAHDGLKKKEFSSIELTKSYLDKIKKRDIKIDAYLEVTEELAMKQAEIADKKISTGEFNKLTGIPLAIKDIILVKDELATGGSKILENYRATYNATVINKLEEQSAVFLGKTNLDEFAMGSSTENSGFKKTHNPWDLDRVPGGSSGGSTASVAADMCVASLGTDTGGSIRQPAAFCGVVGMKPTFGRVSRYGVMAMTSSLDQVGPITKTVKDAAILYSAITGHDPQDSSTYDKKNINIGNIDRNIKGIRIGIPKEYFIEGMNPDIRKLVEDAINKLKELGAIIVDVSLPLTKYALAVYQLTVTSEVATNLARYDGIRYGYSAMNDPDQEIKKLIDQYYQSKGKGFGNEVKRRILLGTFALSAGYYDQYYVKAQKLRVMIRNEFEDIFKKVDCLVTPTSPTSAFKFSEKFEDPLVMYLSDIYTVPANIGGICGISVPCGLADDLPVGLQLMAKSLGEEMLFRIAHHYEQATDWHNKRPKLD